MGLKNPDANPNYVRPENYVATTQPASGPFVGLDPSQYFGSGMKDRKSTNPFYAVGAGENRVGAGLYGLPPAFAGWTGPSRYAFAPAIDYVGQAQQATDYFKDEMGKDYTADLYSKSSDVAEAQFSEGRRRGDQARAQAGGSASVSPYVGAQLQAEAAARAGVMGNAARMSVLQGQAMKSEATTSFLNSLAGQLSALLIPAQLQAAHSAKAPLGQVGPSPWGAGAAAAGQFAGAMA